MYKKDYTFSIIIPHKNYPELLQRALDSIPYRADTQIIIVDDNSDPSKVNFDNFPGKDRPNTEIYFSKSTKRTGAGYARNIGLDHAKGKWALFMDADDEFSPEINTILDKAKTDETHDLIYFNCLSKNFETNEISEFFATRNFIKYSNPPDDLRFHFHAPWCKIIKRQIIVENNIKFEEISHANDVMFSMYVDLYAKKIRYISLVGYYYSIRQSSLTQTIEKGAFICRIQCLYRLYKFGKKHKINTLKVDSTKLYLQYLNSLSQLSKFHYYYILFFYHYKFGLLKQALQNFKNAH